MDILKIIMNYSWQKIIMDYSWQKIIMDNSLQKIIIVIILTREMFTFRSLMKCV